jgi:hypothetical protein
VVADHYDIDRDLVILFDLGCCLPEGSGKQIDPFEREVSI